MSVVLKYDPPLGPVGAGIATLFGEAPSQTVRVDLLHLKRLFEVADTSP